MLELELLLVAATFEELEFPKTPKRVKAGPMPLLIRVGGEVVVDDDEEYEDEDEDDVVVVCN